MNDVLNVKRELNRSKEKVALEVVSPEIRREQFTEMVKGFPTLELAQEEARRCLRCPKKPCVQGCPVNNYIPEFIEQVEIGNIANAYKLLLQRTSLPGVCSRVCPQEKQCEGACTRGKNGQPVNIGALERFVSDQMLGQPFSASDDLFELSESRKTELQQLKVAVIGSGPAGVGVADVLSQAGVAVDMFEERSYLGGVMTYGIPTFRLPRQIVEQKFAELADANVQFKLNTQVGKDISWTELVEKYNGIFLGNGAQIGKRARIPGEELPNVLQALDFLDAVTLEQRNSGQIAPTSVTTKFTGQNIVVVGGGNVAMDVAATAMRCGAQSVTITYRRSLAELPARVEEIKLNQEEGVQFKLLSSPVAVLSDDSGKVRALLAQEVELGEPDESGRRCPIVKPETEFEIAADVIIMAIGSEADTELGVDTIGVATSSNGYIAVDENYNSDNQKVWAGGDTVTGPLTVVNAMASGRVTAKDMVMKMKV